MIQSRFDIRISYYLVICIVISFVTSLFALQLFVGLLSILWLLEKLSEKKKALDIYTYFIIAFGLIRIVAVIFSRYQSSSVDIFYKEILFYLGLFSFVFYLKIFDLKKLRNILYIFIGSAALVALIGIINFNLNQVERAEAFTSYTTFASYLLVAFGFAVSINFGTGYKYKNVILILVITLIFSGIITSLGRTAAGIAILIFAASIVLRKLNYKSAIAVALLTTAICFISFNINKKEISQRIENPTALSDRDVIYKGAEDLFFRTPVFGFGPRTFHQTFPFADEFSDKGVGGWHNDYLQIYFETGVLGMISYIALLILLFVNTFRFIKKHKGNDNFIKTGYGILFAFSGLFLTTFTIGFITHVVLSIVFAFLIGLLSGFDKRTVLAD